MVAAALAQVELGFAAFALRANAKVPVTDHGFKNATRKPDWVETQLMAPPAGNYGIVWPEGADPVMAFDLDNGSDGREAPWQDRLLDLIRTIGPLPPTKATTTPSGGRHAFYRWPADRPLPPGDELFGFTVRWPGRGYLVGPGSSINGVTYLAGPEERIADLPPEWVAAAINDRATTRLGNPNGLIVIQGGFQLPDQIPGGRRYATVRDYVASRYNSGLSMDELWDLVRTQVAPRFTTPKTETELRSDFQRVIAKIGERLGPPRRTPAAVPVGPLEDAPLTEFTSEPIEWLWPSWLPRGVVTLMDGNPGVAKSTVVADLVARITTAGSWPDGGPVGGVGRVMWITTEDDPGRVLRPRIEAAGGDCSLVRFVKSEVVFPSGAGAFRELVVQRASEPLGLALVILDPLFSHIEAGVRTIADAEMRKGVMNPLSAAAEAAEVSILVIRHFSKDSAATAINRGAGSLGGIAGAARAMLTVIADPEDDNGETKVIGVSKSNYAKEPPALRYQVVGKLPPGWISGTVSGIEWLGSSAVSVSKIMVEPPTTRGAVEALEELLGKGPLSARDAINVMRSHGFGQSASRSAASRLHVVKAKVGMTGGWMWRLPSPGDETANTFEGVEDVKGRIFEDVEGVSGRTFEDAEGVGLASSTPSGDADTGLAGAHPREEPAPSSSSTSSGGIDIFEDVEGVEDVGASRAPGPARAREGHWLRPCRDYTAHQSGHRQTPLGWVCVTCDSDQ